MSTVSLKSPNQKGFKTDPMICLRDVGFRVSVSLAFPSSPEPPLLVLSVGVVRNQVPVSLKLIRNETERRCRCGEDHGNLVSAPSTLRPFHQPSSRHDRTDQGKR